MCVSLCASRVPALLNELEMSTMSLPLPHPPAAALRSGYSNAEICPRAPPILEQERLMAESSIPACSNKEHQESLLASTIERAGGGAESLPFHDASTYWLTAQVLLTT